MVSFKLVEVSLFKLTHIFYSKELFYNFLSRDLLQVFCVFDIICMFFAIFRELINISLKPHSSWSQCEIILFQDILMKNAKTYWLDQPWKFIRLYNLSCARSGWEMKDRKRPWDTFFDVRGKKIEAIDAINIDSELMKLNEHQVEMGSAFVICAFVILSGLFVRLGGVYWSWRFGRWNRLMKLQFKLKLKYKKPTKRNIKFHRKLITIKINSKLINNHAQP